MKPNKEKEDYERMMQKGHLSKKGLRYYISILKGEIIDYETGIMQDGKESDKDRRDLKKHNERIKK